MENRIIVFAGPNGSGKTSTIERRLTKGDFSYVYICSDSIVKSCFSFYNINSKESYLPVFEFCNLLWYASVKQKLNIAMETVFSSDNGKIAFLEHAKKEGYIIELYFITTCSPDINVKRVKARAEKGGHNVPNEKIISRYGKSMSNLPELLSIADVSFVVDNSKDSRVGKPEISLIKNSDGNIYVFRGSLEKLLVTELDRKNVKYNKKATKTEADKWKFTKTTKTKRGKENIGG